MNSVIRGQVSEQTKKVAGLPHDMQPTPGRMSIDSEGRRLQRRPFSWPVPAYFPPDSVVVFFTTTPCVMAPNMAVPRDIARAEHIAFLRLLHDTGPARPSKNEPGDLPIRHEDYVLPFDRERQFVGACAFLSNIRSQIHSIPAVCVRESRETESLELLITANKRAADDGRDYLRDMKSGLEGIFKSLRRTNIGEPKATPDELGK